MLLNELELEARKLDASEAEMQDWMMLCSQYAQRFLAEQDETPAFDTGEYWSKELEVGEQEFPLAELLPLFEQYIRKPGINPASAGHLAYIPGGGVPAAGLGDFLAALTNKYAGIFQSSPGAAQLENYLVQWTGEVLGWTGDFYGNLTSGGSMANLIGITAARDKRKIKGADLKNHAIYCSEQMHHCLQKALRITGLSECQLRFIPLENDFTISVDALQAHIEQDKANGIVPWLLIASAGTTDVGAIDPLDKLADIAAQHDLWFHVDGAYGGFFYLVPELRGKFKGIERADSLVVDPHKGLFLPYGSGVILVQDKEHLFTSHRYQEAAYMQDALTDEGLSPADVSPELSKHFRGMRMWLPLKLKGLNPFKAALHEKYLLAQHAYQELQVLPGIDFACSPELSVVTFRFNFEEEEQNDRLMQRVNEDGRVYLSSTRLNGKFYLRLAILAFRTHQKTVDIALELVKENYQQMTSKHQLS